MKVRLTTHRVLSDGRPQCWGDILDLPHNEAARLIEHGQAVRIEDAPDCEMIEPARRAVHDRAAARKG